MNISKNDFGRNFHWGVSSAAFQVEGAHDKDGKGESIWDFFSNKKNKIYNGHHARVACDFYNRHYEDILLMKQMNVFNYRFSLSWSRIFPEGIGKVNHKGVEFYNRVIDFCLNEGIEPWITLYHWDLPLALERKGGWTNREIIKWFSEYVSFCIKTFGDRVKHWMILNEPMVFTGAGYFMGIHAPGKKGLSNFLAAAHHAVLCQAEGGRIAKSYNSNLKIGTTFSCSHIEAKTNSIKDQQAQVKIDALLNRMFLEPLLGLNYPVKDLKVLRRIEQFIKDGDDKKMCFNMDFIGVQNYTREIVSFDFFTPFVQAKIVKADKRNVHRTVMNWEVYPSSIYYILKKYAAYKNVPEIIVTESGAAFEDTLIDGNIQDEERKLFIQNHIAEILKAKQEGVKVNGYFVWSFTDNFEWAEGYKPRFGLVYVDFETQQRTIKASGKWYSDFLSG